MALLQHYGAPTRFIDVSLNAFVALWFAVEKGDKDGRVFAFDATDRLINEERKWRPWEDVLARPWPRASRTEIHDLWAVEKELEIAGGEMPAAKEWKSQYWVWIPSGHEPRIRSQHGAFIFGGVPAAAPGLGRKGRASGAGIWEIARTREAMSVPIRLHHFGGGGRPPEKPCFTIRINGKAKHDIRTRLEVLYGYKKSTLFPDYPGFAEHAIDLPARPPNLET